MLRLYVLRATYLLIAAGLGLFIWPGIVAPPSELSHMGSVVRAMLGAVAVLALVGVRYPLKMLPVLLFELVWKSIWVVAFWLPTWWSKPVPLDASQTFFDCVLGIVIVLLAVPWGYVLKHYVRASGERWRRIAT